jgi:hypothetical protein
MRMKIIRTFAFGLLALLTPEYCLACSACTLGIFAETFPFLNGWLLLFIGWISVYLPWAVLGGAFSYGPPRSRKVLIESGVIVLVIFFTGFSLLLFYWVYMVTREIRLVYIGELDEMQPAVRKPVLYLNGLTAAALVVSIGVTVPGHDDPHKLMERLGGHGLQSSLQEKIADRGSEMVPLLGKALTAGIADPACADEKDYMTSKVCSRARTSAHLLARIGDARSRDLLAIAAASETAPIAESAKFALERLARNQPGSAAGK